MRLAGIVLLIHTALLPLAAGAVDVKLGMGTEAGYDSNVGRSSQDEGDFTFRFSPSIDFLMQDSKFAASLRYVPTYEVFVTFSELNDVTHNLSNSFSYAVSDKTRLSLNNSFRILNVLNFDDEVFIEGEPSPVPNNDIGRDRILTFGSAFNLSHSFSPRWTSNTDVAYTLFETERTNASDSMSLSAFQNFNYAINAANRVGVGGGGVLQSFDGTRTAPSSNTWVFRAWGSYVRNFGERTTLSIRLGPAVISNNQDSASGFAQARFPHTPVDDDTTLGELRDLFGNDGIGEAQGFDDSVEIPAGSVLVPDAASCSGTDPSVGVILGVGCNHQQVLRLGEMDAAADVAVNDLLIATIQDAQQDVTIIGSSSGSEDTKVTLFGDITLSHIWMPNLVSTATYNRSQSSAAGQGAGTIADSVSFLTTWRPTPLWNVSITASYVKRESPNNLSQTFLIVTPDLEDDRIPLVSLSGDAALVETKRSIDTQRWAVGLRAARRISRRMTASARAYWSDQESQNSVRSPNNFGVFTVFMGIKYDFDPLHF